ncbi:uncharacterized protein [Diabrotica undecimpunctata]|uniref:uncharacterized protein n=1 Tax=Diabrotica undecimpunctata TaxID=50387 RepID=UPI003B637C3B
MEAVDRCSILTGVSASTVVKPLHLNETKMNLIRRTLHILFLENKPPTIKKGKAKLLENDMIPPMSREILRTVLHKLKFRYTKRSWQSILIDKEEIVSWRRRYMHTIRDYRVSKRKIYYHNETWINAGHTVSKIWHDTTLKTRDYHEDMDAACFEKWFENVLQHIEPNSVVVLDNASYHSRLVERMPTMSDRKAVLQNWLREKSIPYGEDMVKMELMTIIRQHRGIYR